METPTETRTKDRHPHTPTPRYVATPSPRTTQQLQASHSHLLSPAFLRPHFSFLSPKQSWVLVTHTPTLGVGLF